MRALFLGFVFAAYLGGGWLSVSGAHAKDIRVVTVGDSTLNFWELTGVCPLRENHFVVDYKITEAFRQDFHGQAELLRVYFDCDDLDKLHMGKGQSARYWAVVAVLWTGEPKRLKRYLDMTNEAYLQSVRNFQDNVKGSTDSADKEYIVSANKLLKDMLNFDAKLGDIRHLGTLAQDANAVYSASVSTVSVKGNIVDRVVQIQGQSLIQGWPIHVMQYVSVRGEDGELEEGLRRARHLINMLYQANDSGV